jgi:hypothetical protein
MIFTSVLKIVKVVTHFMNDSYNVRKDNPDIVGEEFTGQGADPGMKESAAKMEAEK